MMLITKEEARVLNMQAYITFACHYEYEIVTDVFRVLNNYDGTVPPNWEVVDAMRACVFTNPRVDDLIDVLGVDISDELRVFIYDLFGRNPSDDELTRDVVQMLNYNPDIDNVDDAAELFASDVLEYVPTKHQAKVIEDAARKELGAR